MKKKKGLKDLEKILTIPIIDQDEKIESLVCKRCKRAISLMVGEKKIYKTYSRLIWKKLKFGNEIHTCKVWRRLMEGSSSPISLSNLKTNVLKSCKQCVQELQRTSKESFETTYKQHSKTSTKTNLLWAEKVTKQPGKKFIEVVERDNCKVQAW